ncbi:MAG: CHASE2 domain-containing protein [Anaerolineales bacterium]|nr:CHASE2 domain-containing protein [Anaerolineales bacterium]
MQETKPLWDVSLNRGYQLGNYTLLERIGYGGEGVVWSAWDNRRTRVVAIKLLPTLGADATYLSQLSTEMAQQVHLVASLDHPNILPLYEFGVTDDYLYFVMKYNAFGSLSNRLVKGALPPGDVLRLGAQIVSALSYLHGRGIVYRDLKPSNILIDGQEHVYLADFGLARRLSIETHVFHTGRGTAPYAPYEQHANAAMMPQSDVFSLGVMLYEMLSGHLPWDGAVHLAVRQKQANGQLPDIHELNSTLPPAVSPALRKMTAYNWRERPSTAQDAFFLLARALSAYADVSLKGLLAPDGLLDELASGVQDAARLLAHFEAAWQPADEPFPARLTHLAAIHAASLGPAQPRLALDDTQRQFMLRGALALDFNSDYWWHEVADPAARWTVCAQCIVHESERAVARALLSVNADTAVQAAQPPLSAAAVARLIDLAVGKKSWTLRHDALAVLERALPPAAHWRPHVFSPEGDAQLSALAVSDRSHAQRVAQLIGRARSETAVLAILAAAPDVGESRVLQTLVEVRRAAGSLPAQVPTATRLRITAGLLRERLLDDQAGISLPRVALGALVGLLFVGLMLTGTFGRLDVQMRDSLLVPYPVSGVVTIVAIDDAALDAYGRWDAWPRTLHAALIERLDAAGARAIVFDVVFAAETAADAALAAAITQAGTVVQPVLGQGDAFAVEPGLMQFAAPVLPQADLRRASAGLGHTNILHDVDGYVRRLPTMVRMDGVQYPSLALAAIQVYLSGAQDLAALPVAEDGRLPFVGREIPVGEAGDLTIFYAAPPASGDAAAFPIVSFRDVLEDNVDPTLFADKIVLVGIMATAEPDRYLTPVSTDGRPMYGVEIMANVVESVWSGRFIHRPETAVLALILLLLGGLTGALANRPWSGLGLAVVLGAGYVFTAVLLFEFWNVMLDIFYPVSTIGVGYAAVITYRLSTEARRRREIMRLFEANVTPAVAEATVSAVRRGEINLAGQAQEVTVLIADLRGPRVSESEHDPADVVEQINRSKNLVVSTALRLEGTAAYTEGEQVMILFNAPLPQVDHAWRAVETAFAVQEQVELMTGALLAESGARPAGYGFGVYTGRAIVGSMGAAPRQAYTALGDTVSIAAQLAAQAEPGQVMVGGAAYRAVAEQVVVTAVTQVVLKEPLMPIAAYVVTREKA